MIQLLVVDDEQIEREGMKAILRGSFPSLIIHEARNGNTAIETVERYKPDLILMDIKMPGMTGLEALVKIMARYPHTKFIMVTAYDTFDYMRKAIKLGATDYILKPSKSSDIVETVGKVLKEIVVDRKSRVTTQFQKEVMQKTMAVIETDVVTQLLFEHVHDVHLDMLVEILDINTENEMFVLNVLFPHGTEQHYSAIKEKIKHAGSGLVGAIYENQLPIIIFRNHEKTFRSEAIHLAREILSVEKSGGESNWFVGIGNVYESLNYVRKSYQESMVATVEIQGAAKYRFYSDVPFLLEGNIEEMIKQLKKEIPDQVRLGQWEQVNTRVQNAIQTFEGNGAIPIQTQQRILEVLWVIGKALNDMGIETDTPLYAYQTLNYRQLRSETSKLLSRMQKLYSEYYSRLEADTIEQIRQYIIEHSHEDISLETLGNKMALSPIYISKMFKEKMGINYIDFLTECRIEKAKKLMSEPNRSIKEIAIEVGYHEPNYFSKVFKKIVRVSPREYQNSVLGKKD